MTPSQDRQLDAEGQASSRSQQPPNAGGGRQIDPPTDDAISIRDVKAVPNYNSTLGTANYQANMRLMNGDPDWTAAQVCIDVHFRDRGWQKSSRKAPKGDEPDKTDTPPDSFIFGQVTSSYPHVKSFAGRLFDS